MKTVKKDFTIAIISLVCVFCAGGVYILWKYDDNRRTPERGEAVECRIIAEDFGYARDGKSKVDIQYRIEWKDKEGKWRNPIGEFMEMPTYKLCFDSKVDAERYVAWAVSK